MVASFGPYVSLAAPFRRYLGYVLIQLYLASKSPRRRELLAQLSLVFECIEGSVDESVLDGETPQDYVLRLATAKAVSGQDNLATVPSHIPILGSDTSVEIDNQILGKPRDEQEAVAMLARLSGNSHMVYTAVAIKHNRDIKSVCCATKVFFAAMTASQINSYVATGEPMDKAGAYGIQGLGGRYIKKIEGSYTSVVGLPLYETSMLLTECGVFSD
jgi:septum formation protein